jgi:hypothetical protein
MRTTAALVRLTLTFVAPMIVTFAAQRAWLSRMTRSRQRQGWSHATWGMALLWLGPLSMIPFCWVTRTRRGLSTGLVAIGTGALASIALLAVCGALDALVALALGLEP